MGGHPDIARQIQDRGADYILALKANEPAAHQAVIAHFEAQRTTTAEIHDQGGWVQGSEVSTTCEQNRGRYEQREVVVSRELDCLRLAYAYVQASPWTSKRLPGLLVRG